LTVSKISEMLGTEITTLLGADILSDYKILFDYKNEIIEFNKEAIAKTVCKMLSIQKSIKVAENKVG
jgi:hypothetical protein